MRRRAPAPPQRPAPAPGRVQAPGPAPAPPQSFRPSPGPRPPQGFRPSQDFRSPQGLRPSPAARVDRSLQYRAKRPSQPATGKFGPAIIIGWIILSILMSIMRQFR